MYRINIHWKKMGSNIKQCLEFFLHILLKFEIIQRELVNLLNGKMISVFENTLYNSVPDYEHISLTVETFSFYVVVAPFSVFVLGILENETLDNERVKRGFLNSKENLSLYFMYRLIIFKADYLTLCHKID